MGEHRNSLLKAAGLLWSVAKTGSPAEQRYLAEDISDLMEMHYWRTRPTHEGVQAMFRLAQHALYSVCARYGNSSDEWWRDLGAGQPIVSDGFIPSDLWQYAKVLAARAQNILCRMERRVSDDPMKGC
jgi:hypothetical protein